MLNLVKAELFRFIKSKSIWIILFVIIACSSISIFTGVYSSAENTFLNIAKDVMVIILSFAIYCGVSFSSDFQNRTIIHYIVGGQKRSYIVIAQLFHYFLGCIVLILGYPFISTFIAGILNGFETSVPFLLAKMIKIIFMGLPLYLSIASLFYMIMIIVRQGVFAMGISVALSIVIVVFTNKLYFGNIGNCATALRFSPIIELQVLAKDVVTFDYLISLFIAVALIFTTFFISKLVFEKLEIN